jgi:hypothetical protein
MKFRILLLLILAQALSVLHAKADTITYTETATATGSLGSTSFTNATVTLAGTGNSAGITTPAAGIFALVLPVSVQISGIGTFAFTDTVQVVDNQAGSVAGFGDNSNSLGILFDMAAAFSSYNLGSSIGPISGTPAFNFGGSFGTAGGSFILTSVSSDSFKAVDTTTSPVPEPSSFAILGTGMAGLAGLARRGFKAKS